MFVKPLTVLGFIQTMREEGHTALVHAAAASNLGQMLVKACVAAATEAASIADSIWVVSRPPPIGSKARMLMMRPQRRALDAAEGRSTSRGCKPDAGCEAFGTKPLTERPPSTQALRQQIRTPASVKY